MKNLNFLFVLLMIHVTSFTQSCLSEGITFNTQEEINNFQSNYPGCVEIEGFVTISGSDEITNLNGLSVITSIAGRLRIYSCSELTNLSGLDNLTSIGGDLDIYGWPSGNPSLTSIDGLNNLTHVGGGVTISQNEVLTNINGLEGLTTIDDFFSVDGNIMLIDFNGLNNLSYIGGNIWIGENNSMTTLTGLESLISIGGEFQIYENHTLNNFEGLHNLTSIGGGLRINYTYALSSFAGLNNLTSIGGGLIIYDNEALITLSGLDNIVSNSITELLIRENPNLLICEIKSVCDYIANPNADIDIANNAMGCNNENEVTEACNTHGIENHNLQSQFIIYPNPSKNKIYIEFNTSKEKDIIIKIYNCLGRVEISHNYSLKNSENQILDIDLNCLSPGIYFIELKQQKISITEKLVKLKN